MSTNDTTHTPTRQAVSGRFTQPQLKTLLHPIAWSGTVDQATRDAAHQDLRDLVREALDAIGAADGGFAVEIDRGTVGAVLVDL